MCLSGSASFLCRSGYRSDFPFRWRARSGCGPYPKSYTCWNCRNVFVTFITRSASLLIHCFNFLVSCHSFQYFEQNTLLEMLKSKVSLYIWLKWIRIRIPQHDADPTWSGCTTTLLSVLFWYPPWVSPSPPLPWSRARDTSSLYLRSSLACSTASRSGTLLWPKDFCRVTEILAKQETSNKTSGQSTVHSQVWINFKKGRQNSNCTAAGYMFLKGQ